MRNCRVLTEDHLILGNSSSFPEQTTYQPQIEGVYSTIANVHAGQNKLLLSEIQLLMKVHIDL